MAKAKKTTAALKAQVKNKQYSKNITFLKQVNMSKQTVTYFGRFSEQQQQQQQQQPINP